MACPEGKLAKISKDNGLISGRALAKYSFKTTLITNPVKKAREKRTASCLCFFISKTKKITAEKKSSDNPPKKVVINMIFVIKGERSLYIYSTMLWSNKKRLLSICRARVKNSKNEEMLKKVPAIISATINITPADFLVGLNFCFII